MAVREMIGAANSWWDRLDRKPGTWEAFDKTLRMEFVQTFEIETDASVYVIGVVLFQIGEPIASERKKIVFGPNKLLGLRKRIICYHLCLEKMAALFVW